MSALARITAPFRWLNGNISLLLRRPARMQVAALCHREVNGERQVLLITSRKAKRWIIPKGWPMAGLSARKSALREAYEEAGIRGKVGKNPIGEYPSKKNLGNGLIVDTKIVVYPVEVSSLEKNFPESGIRNSEWLTVTEAEKRCNDSNLSHILKSWASEYPLSI